jgi:mitogen-activated protein kinase kinase
MSTPIRKKRNFKALQLQSPPASPVTPLTASEEIKATRQAPTGGPGGKKRPAPITLKAPKIPNRDTPTTPQEQQLLTVQNGSNSAPNTASPGVTKRNTYHATLSSTLANLDMNAEIKFDLRNEDLKDLQELGQGNGGSVKKVEHIPTGTMMAKKVRRPEIIST